MEEGVEGCDYNLKNKCFVCFALFCFKEMAHWLRALTAFAEDWGLVPSIYPESSSQLSETPVSGDLTPNLRRLLYAHGYTNM